LSSKITFDSKADISAIRFTPKADLHECDLNVRFGPEAGLCSAAKSRYSITLSALVSSASGL
jgi:hypothetical protein